jgi:hypothetical protein
MPIFDIGTRVKVCQGAGLDSGREGIVIHPSCVPLDDRGVPNLGDGHYNPFDSSREAALLDDEDNLFTMFWSFLERA